MAIKITILFCFLTLTKASLIENGYSQAAPVSFSSYSSSPVVTKTVIGPIKKTIITPTAFSKAAPDHFETVISADESKFKNFDGAEHSKFSKSVDTAYSSSKFDSHVTNGDLLNHETPTFYATQASPVYYGHGTSLGNSVLHVVSPYTKSVSIPISYSAPVSKTIITPDVSYDSYLSSDNFKAFAPSVYSPSFTKIGTPSILYGSPIEKSTNIYHVPIKVPQPAKYTTYDSYATTADKSNIDTPITYHSQITKNYAPFLTYGPPVVENSLNHISHGPVVVSKSATTYSEAPVVSHLSFSGLGTNYGW